MNVTRGTVLAGRYRLEERVHINPDGAVWRAVDEDAIVVCAAGGLPASGAVAFAAVSAVIHVAYTAALLQSYRLGEFGRTYPLARGTAPLLVGAGAWVIVGEHLTALQIVGTCTIAGALTGIAVTLPKPMCKGEGVFHNAAKRPVPGSRPRAGR